MDDLFVQTLRDIYYAEQKMCRRFLRWSKTAQTRG
jgi:ferritin-like metal-binding protein YciE